MSLDALDQLTSKYIASAEKVLSEIQRTEGTISISKESVERIIEYVKAYLADAKYYRAQKRLEVSLTSVAYCEGLLDSLKLLGAVKFEWPTSTIQERKK